VCFDGQGFVVKRALVLVRLGAALLALTAIASLVASPDRRTSLPYVFQVLLGAGCVLAVAGRPVPGIRRRLTPSRLITIFVALGYVALTGILFSTRWPIYKLSFLSGLYAAIPSIRSLPVSLFSQGLTPNQAGGLMATFTAFALAVAITAVPAGSEPGRWRRHQRIAAAFLGVCGTGVVFMTGSRAALVAVGVAVMVILVARDRRWLLLPAVGAAAMVVVVLIHPDAPRAVLEVFLRDETIETKLIARLDIWRSVLRAIQDHPFTGIGLGVLNQILPFRYPYETVGLSFTVTHAHDVYLDTALTLGVAGLVGLLFVLAGLIWTSLAIPAHLPTARTYALGMLASAVVFMVFGITDSLSLSTPSSLVLWAWVVTLSLVAPYDSPSYSGCAEPHTMVDSHLV
jgi:O-antigen ligase